MSKKPYSWVAGAVLEEHSRRKHKVIAEYVARYLTEEADALLIALMNTVG